MRISVRHHAGRGAWTMASALVLCPLAGAAAQVTINSHAAEITLTGRAHSQFNSTSVAGEPGTEFLIRRARLAAELEINDFVSGKVEPDFGEGGIALKDVYLRLTFGPAFRATFGQLKRPFDLFELTSSTQILVVERAGEIRGVGACAGPGGLCSFSRFTEKLQYSDRDVGVFLDGAAAAGTLGWAASVTNGAGANKEDENGAKSFTARLEATPARNVTLAGNIAVHDYVPPSGGATEYATAFGGDVEIGSYGRGLHVQGGVATGDNWRNLAPTDPSTFVTVQGIVSYRAPVTGNARVSAVEPLARASWGDPDTGAAADDGLLLTPGLMIHFTGRNKIAANVDVWLPAAGDAEWSLKVQSYLYF